MTLPVDIILDLHQDGLRVHINTGKYEEVRITGAYDDGTTILPKQMAVLIDWLTIAKHVIEQRQQGHKPVTITS